MTAIRGAAAITGAASGIGRALAIELARRGCDLALADRDEAGLKTLAAEIGPDRKISVHRVDVAEPADIAQFAAEATSAHPAGGGEPRLRAGMVGRLHPPRSCLAHDQGRQRLVG